MSAAGTQFLTGQLDAYAESWQRDHADALACWELEARLEIALALFHVIRRVDQEMAQQAAAGHLNWDASTTNQLMHFYQTWCAPADAINARIADLRGKGFEVVGSDEFQRAVMLARSSLAISLDQLALSAAQARQGNLKSLGEVRDALQRQLDSRR